MQEPSAAVGWLASLHSKGFCPWEPALTGQGISLSRWDSVVNSVKQYKPSLRNKRKGGLPDLKHSVEDMSSMVFIVQSGQLLYVKSIFVLQPLKNNRRHPPLKTHVDDFNVVAGQLTDFRWFG